MTVYEKGAELVRMYHTILGEKGFRKGMDLYFKRHDGQAVTTDDFYQSMVDANGICLEGFKNWYSQAGTPTVKVETEYDPKLKLYRMHCTQSLPKTPGQEKKEPLLIPLVVGLLEKNGKEIKLEETADMKKNGILLKLGQPSQTFTFTNIESEPLPSIGRGFSAPMILDYPQQTEEDLCILLGHDTDEFNRWEASQKLYFKVLLNSLVHEEPVPPALVDALSKVLKGALSGTLDKGFVARVMSLPSQAEIVAMVPEADPIKIYRAREGLIRSLAQALQDQLRQVIEANEEKGQVYRPDQIGKSRRSLKNVCLSYLSTIGNHTTFSELLDRMTQATNMTDQIASLAFLVNHDCQQRNEALETFYNQWKEDKLVMLKWLMLQASCDLQGNLSNVQNLMKHKVFDIKNPNCVYSLVGGFPQSAINFHHEDGSGYKYLADTIMELDKINPQVAARMIGPFTKWKCYDKIRQGQMTKEIERVLQEGGRELSENVYEIISKTLQDAPKN